MTNFGQQTIYSMANSNDVLEISKALQGILQEVKNAARLMGQATEKLSNSGINKLTEELKASLKNRKILNELEVNAITDGKKMAATLDALEKQHEAILKIEAEAEKQKKRALKSAGAAGKNDANIKKADEAAKRYVAAKLEEIDITTEHAKNLKAEIPLIRQETEARAKAIASTDGLRLMHENLSKTIGEQVRGFATFGNAMAHLKKAFFTSYDQMNRISSQGMLGTFETLQVYSIKLMMSAKDLEDILSKNRDLINQMGGGIAGVKAFGDEIYKTGDQLRYLGKDWAKAGADFIDLSKKSGLTPKDGKAYRQNMNQSIESFKNFSAMFGDTPDQFKALMEGMQDDVNIRNRLNGLSKTQLANEMEEQRQRAYNLKLIGLSNEQIVEFNKKLANVVDPRKAGDVGERAKNALMVKQTYAQMVNLLQNGTPEEKQLAAQMKEQQGALGKIADISTTGSPEQIRKAMEENPEAAAMYNKGFAATDQMNRLKLEGRNITAGQTGNLGTVLDQMGGAQNTATAQGKNLKQQNNPDQLAALEKKNREELLADHSAEAKALADSAVAYETVNKILEGPFAQALLAGVAALMAFNTAVGIKGILGGLGTLGTGLKGLAGQLMGKGGLISTLGRAGVAYGIDKVLGGMGVGGNEIDEGADAANWKQMSTWEKVQSGAARGVEGAGNTFGLTNLSNQAQSDRIRDESDYLKKNGNRGVGAVPKNVSTGATSSQNPASASNSGVPYDFNSYAQKLGQRESGAKGYSTVNTIGFVGKYQFGAAALEDLGLVKPGTGKKGNKALNDPANWNTPGGLQGFLADSNAQENAFKQYTNTHYQQLLKAGVITPQSTPEEVAGYLATAHLKGIGGAIDLKNGKSSTDAYGTSTSSYFALGAGSQGGGTNLASSQPISGPNGAVTPGPGMQSAAAGTGSAPVGTSTASVATTVASGSQSGGDANLTELRKQTSLLASIASNTTNRSINPVNPNAYKQDTAIVMGGVAG